MYNRHREARYSPGVGEAAVGGSVGPGVGPVEQRLVIGHGLHGVLVTILAYLTRNLQWALVLPRFEAHSTNLMAHSFRRVCADDFRLPV